MEVVGLHFSNRLEAGQVLASLCEDLISNKQPLIIGLPRGGVPIAWQMAKILGLSWQPLFVRKLGLPSQPELAIGAIASGCKPVLHHHMIESFHVSSRQLEAVILKEQAELKRREKIYPYKLKCLAKESIVLVDDGVATGATMEAAILCLRNQKVKDITIAVPVASDSSINRLKPMVDDIRVAHVAHHMMCIGQFYKDFSQLSDQDVLAYIQ